MNESLAEKDESLSRVEQVYRTIRECILSNQYPPSYQALEPEIARQLGVSRTPVREALIRLEAEKLIELIPRRGMRVLPLAPNDYEEISRVLIAFELMALELLVDKNPGKDVLAPMEDALLEMDESLQRDNLDEWSEAEEKYFRLLIILCGNGALAQLVDNLRARTHRSRMVTLKMRPKPYSSNEANRKVFEAILMGHKEKALEVHKEHRNAVLHTIMELLERYRLPHL